MFSEGWSRQGAQKGYKGYLAPYFKNVGTGNGLWFLKLWSRCKRTLQKMSESPLGSLEDIFKVPL